MRHRFRRVLGTTLVIAIIAAVPGAASAAPEHQEGTADVAAQRVSARHTITLVTGDIVTLEQHADGGFTTTVAAGPGRSEIPFRTQHINGQVYLVPADAMPLISADRLDKELFNLTALVADGYDDASSDGIPLIIDYPATRMSVQTAPTLPGATVRHTLESINAQAVTGTKAQARDLWRALSGAEDSGRAGVSGSAAPVGKVWLSRRVRATLHQSVAQVGAPQVWDAGYDGTGVTVAVLDTGVDDIHPDLDGLPGGQKKVVAAANFTGSADTKDRHGHGTHVASTVAGTGEATSAARRGVAPGAKVINAKVLDDSGNGTIDGVIEGLEWAAAHGADIASMSIGTSSAATGPDPMSRAVDAISRSSGMLVVVAASNNGPGESTIGSPGWADEALTVGAVTKADALASFSSRGPRLGDFAIKPDITAPGNAIVAARAAGTSRGSVVDQWYTSLNGTSMATPHVAGAAALLAQKFPGHTGRQLKDLLISTSRTITGQTVYQQGGGRLDVARAAAQPVTSSPGTLNLGYFRYPQTGAQPVTKTVNFSNSGTSAVTLALELKITNKQGQPAPAGMFTTGTSSVAVPAGGSATVEVTVNPLAGPTDLYGGHLIGTAPGINVHTTVGAYVEPELYTVTVNGIARDGRPAVQSSAVDLWNIRTGQMFESDLPPSGGPVSFRVPPGVYSLTGFLVTSDAANKYATEVTLASRPQLAVTANTVITLDARGATELVVKTPQPSATHDVVVSYHRGNGDHRLQGGFIAGKTTRRVFASPTPLVTEGTFEFFTRWALFAPSATAKVTSPVALSLDPYLMSGSPPLDGSRQLTPVYAGQGRPQDYTGLDVTGKAVLVRRNQAISFHGQALAASAAGAFAVIVANDQPGLLLGYGGPKGQVPLPIMGIEQGTGDQLAALIAKGPVSLTLSGMAVSTYAYHVLAAQRQQVPDTMLYQIGRSNSVRISTQFRGTPAGQIGGDVWHMLRPFPTQSIAAVRDIPLPSRRTDWVYADPDTRWLHEVYAGPQMTGRFVSDWQVYRPDTDLSHDWLGAVLHPGGVASTLPVTRTGDEFTMNVHPLVDAKGHAGSVTAGDTYTTRWYADGNLLRQTTTPPKGAFPALPQAAGYRLELDTARQAPWASHSTTTRSVWAFGSQRPAEGVTQVPSMLQVYYNALVDDRNTVPADLPNVLQVRLGHLPGAVAHRVTSLTVELSYDDGQVWQPTLATIRWGDQAFALFKPPRLTDAAAVSVRVRATDAGGGTVEQTITRAYGLR